MTGFRGILVYQIFLLRKNEYENAYDSRRHPNNRDKTDFHMAPSGLACFVTGSELI